LKERIGSVFLVLCLLLIGGKAFGAETESFPDPAKFPLPEGYKPNVDFWFKVYTEWEEDDVAIHDQKYMSIIFDVIDIPNDSNLVSASVKSTVGKRMDEIRRVLLELHQNPEARERSNDHKKIFDLYKDINEANKFRNAADNLRAQQGVKDRFRDGLQRMTMYIGPIRKVFREEGLPEEVAYLPLVESSFNNLALSKTKAAGIWQFMPATARFYMKVNSDLDERLDPVVASRAAARYLKRSYQQFGTWPLALTSYNHGQAGIANAINTTGTTDFWSIYQRYQGKSFKFASKNFYAEFLAAYRSMKEASKHFGALNYAKPRISNSVRLSSALSASALMTHSGLTREELRLHNPALSSHVLYAKRPIPAGYQLRLPAEKFSDPGGLVASVRSKQKTAPVVAKATPPKTTQPTKTKTTTTTKTKTSETYVVRKGDTLYSISKKFALTVEAIRKLNGLTHSNIFPGQKLFVGSR
jgi:membrane-bound lytic murein transglycosylase D